MFCTQCGKQLEDGVKFCSSCGSPIKNQTNTSYAGNNLKCPNCGAPLSSISATCPSCGIGFSSKVSSAVIKDFNRQLSEIDNENKGLLSNIVQSISSTVKENIEQDKRKRKLMLIRNFPVPNSLDEIMEFILLAESNIDTNLSKKTFFHRGPSGNIDWNITQRDISDEWVVKLQQIYAKAKIVFKNDPSFPTVKKHYFDIMEKLNLVK